MSAMSITRDVELEHVSSAFFLEGALVSLAEKKERNDRAKPAKPKMPQKPVFCPPQAEKEPYPPITVPQPSFPRIWCWSAVFFGIMIFASVPLSALTYFTPGPIHGILNYLIFFSPYLCLGCIVIGICVKGLAEKRAKAKEDQIRNSAGYQEQCAEVDERNRQRQQKVNLEEEKRHKAAVQNYESVVLPKYEKELKTYETVNLPAWKKEDANIRNAISETEATLREVYEQNVIPGKYRNLGALTFIASFMGTSNYDLKFAIERYDNEIDQLIAYEQLNATRAVAALLNNVLQEQQYTNYLQTQTIDMLESGNRLLKNTRNWAAASTALQAVDIIADWRRAKAAR